MKRKFYVVWQGRKPGVYHTWDECKAQVDGYSGAIYKSFHSLKEAKMAYGGIRVEIEKHTLEPSLKKKPAALITEMEILLDKVVTELRAYRLKNPRW